MKFSQIPSGEVIFLLFFSINNWDSEDIMELNEPKRIKAISNFARDLTNFGSEESPDLDQLEFSLTVMKRIFNSSQVLIREVTDMPSLIDEDKWIEQLILTNQMINERTHPDSDWVEKQIQMRMGKYYLRTELNGIAFKLWSQRFHIFTEQILGIALSSEVKLKMTQQNFQMALLMKLFLYDFGHTCFGDQVDFVVGKSVMKHFEIARNIATINVIETYQYEREDYLEKYKIYEQKGKKLTKFLLDDFLQVLLLAYILVKDIEVDEAKRMEKCLSRLIFKKISNSKDFNIFGNAENALDYFFGSLMDLGAFLAHFMSEGMSESKNC